MTPSWPADTVTRWGRRLIGFAGLWVPSAVRRERRMEWEAELWQLRTERADNGDLALFLLGVYWDAMWGWKEGLRMGTTVQDAKYAIRMLGRSPGFALAAILTLGLSIGASTALFSIVQQTVLAAPPYPEPHRLVVVDMLFGMPGDAEFNSSQWSYPRYQALQEEVRSLENLAAYSARTMTLTEIADPTIVAVEVASPSLFPLLGVTATRGRVFGPGEVDDGSPKMVAMVSHEFWLTQLGASPEAVGQMLTLDQLQFQVIGVLPDGFDGVTGDASVWIPVAALREVQEPSMLEDPWNQHLFVMGRLATSATAERAQSEVKAFAATIMERFPPPVGASRLVADAEVMGYRDARENPAVQTSMFVLFVAVFLVLLIATSNLAGLLLARGTARQREAAIRASLGASRSRLLRQLLTESLVLSFIGGTVGIAVAWVGVDALGVWLAEALGTSGGRGLEYIDTDALAIDWRAFLFAMLLTAAVGVGFGLLPAWQAARTNPDRWLKGSSGLGGHRRKWLGVGVRDGLIAGQVALALILLTGASLLLRTTSSLQRLDLGFERSNLLTGIYSLAPGSEEAGVDPAGFHIEVLEALRGVPGVTAASLGEVPMAGPTWRTIVLGSEGRPDLTPADHLWIRLQPVADGHLGMLGVTLLEGRDIQATDERGSERVIVLSTTAANELFPDGNALGQRIRLGWTGYGGEGATVVGVTEDARFGQPGEPIERLGFVSLRQAPQLETGVLIRTTGDPNDLIPGVRAAFASVAPNVVLTSTLSMKSRTSRATVRTRVLTMLLTFFGAVALLLVAVGLYGTIAFAVNRRTRELGLRASLGAGRASLAGLVMRHGLRVTLAGIVLGVLGSLWAGRFLRDLLFETSSVDVGALVAVSLILFGVAAVAAYLPARRGMQVDPIVALRADS